MNYSRFGAICELESAQVPSCASETAVWRPRLRQKNVDLCTFRRQEKCFKCVIIHERATNLYVRYLLIMYLNNVLSCCTHKICIMEQMRWARILDMCRYRILFYLEYIVSD